MVDLIWMSHSNICDGGGGGIWGAPFGRHAALRLFHFCTGLLRIWCHVQTPIL